MSKDVPEDYMTPDYLKKAFKTFRKRPQTETRLDVESTLGSSL